MARATKRTRITSSEVLARPVVLWAALNLLNVLDAALTTGALDSGIAYEANPLVLEMGMTVKLILVAVAGAGVALLRPRALLIPIVILALVVSYTAAGLLVAS
jgi:hypothetical protein